MMKRENMFYGVMMVTILIARISIIIVPEVDLKIFGLIIHHFWFGILLMIIGVMVPQQKTHPKIVVYGLGAGLIVDQLLFMLLGAGNDKEYWALPSVLGAIILALIIYPLRRKLTNFLWTGTKTKGLS